MTGREAEAAFCKWLYNYWCIFHFCDEIHTLPIKDNDILVLYEVALIFLIFNCDNCH